MRDGCSLESVRVCSPLAPFQTLKPFDVTLEPLFPATLSSVTLPFDETLEPFEPASFPPDGGAPHRHVTCAGGWLLRNWQTGQTKELLWQATRLQSVPLATLDVTGATHKSTQ